MVTSKLQTSPANATRYFRDHLSRGGDYYWDGQASPGLWFGRSCELLGIDLNASVQEQDFTALSKGLRPDDGMRLTQRTTTNRRALFDFTISAPKSISIMAVLAQDERLIAAHNDAVFATLEIMENSAQARVRKGAAVDTKESRITGNIVCAHFLHHESRALDPQVHSHCVVFNVTFDPVERRFKALEARLIYDRSKALTSYYRKHLEKSIKKLGYRTYHDRGGCIQIAGVSPQLMAKYSKRAAQRDTLVALRENELGRKLTNNEVSRLVHQNRAKKLKHIDPQTLRRVQLAQLTADERQDLENLKERALTGSRQAPRAAGLASRYSAESNWINVVRTAMLLARSLDINPYLFSPTFSFSERVCFAARFFQQAQRTAKLFRYVSRNQQRGITR